MRITRNGLLVVMALLAASAPTASAQPVVTLRADTRIIFTVTADVRAPYVDAIRAIEAGGKTNAELREIGRLRYLAWRQALVDTVNAPSPTKA